MPNDRPRITKLQFAELLYRETGHPAKAGGTGRLMVVLAGLFIPGVRETV